MKTKTTNLCMILPLVSFISLTGFLGYNPESEIAEFKQTMQSTMHANDNLDLGPLPEVKKYKTRSYTLEAESPFALKAFVLDKTINEDDESVSAHCQSIACGDGPPEDHAPYFLENYELTELSMVGTILNDQQQRVALIQTPNADIINAAKGEYLGKNNGKIITIEEDHVVVREKYKVPLGWQNRMAILELFN